MGFNPFKYTSYTHHQLLQHHLPHQHLQHPQHQQEKHRPKLGCSFLEKVFKMFGLVQIIMLLHARKPYPKPWLQHTRGSERERSPKILTQTLGGNAVKKTECPLFVESSSGKKQESTKSGDSVFFFPQHFSPCLGLSFFQS